MTDKFKTGDEVMENEVKMSTLEIQSDLLRRIDAEVQRLHLVTLDPH